MAKPQIRFEVDWDHDRTYGNANSDITGNVPIARDWVWSSGRSGNSALGNRTKAGKLTLPLLNGDGLYSSFLSSGALFGLILPGRRCRVQLGSRCAQVIRASNQGFSVDAASLTPGNFDYSYVIWIEADTLPGAEMTFGSVWQESGNNRGWQVRITAATGLHFVVSSNGTAESNISAGGVVAGVRMLVIVEHDSVANTISIQFNNGAVASKAHSAGVNASTATFRISRDDTDSNYFDGKVGPAFYIKKTLSTAERTWLHNNGNGRDIGDFGRTGDGSAMLTNLVSYWPLDEASGTRVDAHGSNDLAASGSPGDAEGITNLLSWSGRLDTILPAAKIGRIPSATLTAFGNMATWGAGKPRTTRQTDILTSAAMDKLADDIGWPAASTGARAFETGQTTMPLWFFRSSPTQPTDALKEGQAIEDTEMGWFRESERDDVVFEDRHYRLTGARLTSQRSYSDDPADSGAITYRAIPQSNPIKDVYNRITAEIPSQSLASLTTLWTFGLTGADSPFLGPGETQRFLAEYPGPTIASGDIGAVWTTPDVNDISANSESGGGGSDLFSDLTIEVTKGLDVMVIALTLAMTATTGAYITALKARGQAVQAGNPQSVEEFDQDSIDLYGDREFQLRAKFLGTAQEAVDQARYAVALNKDMVPKMQLEVIASKDAAHSKEAAIRRLSDRITVESDTATKLGIKDLDMFVEAIDHRISGGGSWTTTYTVSEADSSGGKVIVLDTGPGLDTGILGY